MHSNKLRSVTKSPRKLLVGDPLLGCAVLFLAIFVPAAEGVSFSRIVSNPFPGSRMGEHQLKRGSVAIPKNVLVLNSSPYPDGDRRIGNSNLFGPLFRNREPHPCLNWCLFWPHDGWQRQVLNIRANRRIKTFYFHRCFAFGCHVLSLAESSVFNVNIDSISNKSEIDLIGTQDGYNDPRPFFLFDQLNLFKSSTSRFARFPGLPADYHKRDDDGPSGYACGPCYEYVPPWHVLLSILAFISAGAILILVPRKDFSHFFLAFCLIVSAGIFILLGHQYYCPANHQCPYQQPSKYLQSFPHNGGTLPQVDVLEAL